MAIQGDAVIIGGISALGLYFQTRPVLIDKDPAGWRMVYEVRAWKDPSEAEKLGGTRVPCPGISQFSCYYDPTKDGNPVAFAYSNLKSLSLITNASDV